MNNDYLGNAIPKLGFGFMRIPMAGDAIDMDQLKAMVDLYIEKGFTYFDTAYGYVNGRSEGAVRESVVERYPRESVQIATKFPVWEAKQPEDLERIFATQLERTGAGYFDFYMLHAIGGHVLEKLDELKIWDFLASRKEKGLAKHIGFSFHDSAEVLDRILTAHPEVEFVQLQINYIDWDNENVQSRLCYEVAMKHNVPVIVMEPVKGGALASLYGDALDALKSVHPDASAASWAVRYCASLDGIVTVLSGMSNMEQMQDNLSSMSPFNPLDEAERAALTKAIDALNASPTIPCTSCQYCTEKCPQNINIPGIIGVLNGVSRYGLGDHSKGSYGWQINKRGKASECIECGVCESRCPQHIEIIDTLKKAAETFE